MLQNTVIKQLLGGLVFWGGFSVIFFCDFFFPCVLCFLREGFSLRQALHLVFSTNQGLNQLFTTQIPPDFPHLHERWAYLG